MRRYDRARAAFAALERDRRRRLDERRAATDQPPLKARFLYAYGRIPRLTMHRYKDVFVNFFPL